MDTAIWVAIVTAIPAFLAAMAAWRSSARTGRQVKTANGQTLGQTATSNSMQLAHLVGKFDQHCEDANDRFRILEERVSDHEHLAS